MKEFLNFDKMMTPSLIKFIFYIGTALSILTGLFMIGSGIMSPFGGGSMVFLGLLQIILGPFVTRIYCELLIVLFKMNESLQEINNKIKEN